MHTDGETEGV